MLRSLTFRNFRNLEDGTWSPHSGANLVFGPNGAGKSSLLEAIYLAATTKSFRTSRLQDCRRHGHASFHLSAEVEGEARTLLELGLGEEGKLRSVNGTTGPIGEHLTVLPVVTWTGRDADLFQGSPSSRRQFVDRGVVAEKVTALSVLAEYRRALEAKKAALESQPRALAEWNAVLAAKGAALSSLRDDWISRLRVEVDNVLRQSSLGFEYVELVYRPSPREALDGEEALFGALERLRQREIGSGRCLIGPHRDDLELNWTGRSIGRLASAGERKLLGLVLLVAHARLIGRRRHGPLYLIDDLDSELDLERVEQVWEVLQEAPQIVAASSRKSVVNNLPATFRWTLEKGVAGVF